MGQITEGHVVFGDGVKKEEYGALRKAEVRLAFIVGEGESHESIFDRAMAFCRAKVAEMLTGKAPEAAATTASATTEAADKQKRAYTRKAATPPPAADPADMTVEASPAKAVDAAVAAKVEEKKADAAAMDDGLGDILGGAAPAQPVTDQEIVETIQKHNGKLVAAGYATGTPEIRALVAKYAGGGPPKNSRDIPQEKRREFIGELHKIGAPKAA